MVKGLVLWQKSIKDNGLSTQDYKKYYFKHGGGTSYSSNLVEKWLTDKFSIKFIEKF